MLVAHDREGHEILTVAGHQNRGLEREVHKAFQNARGETAAAITSRANLLEVGIGAQHHLAVTIVAARNGFQHGRVMNLIQCGVKLIEVVDGAPRCGGGAVIVNELLLVHTVLGDAQQIGALRGGGDAAHLIDGVGIHILELVGEHVGLHGQIMDGGLVVVFGGDLEIGHLTGRAVWRRIEHANAESHITGG